MSAVRLSQLRSAVAFALLLVRPRAALAERLQVARADVPKLAWLGIAGIALVHVELFAAIAPHRHRRRARDQYSRAGAAATGCGSSTSARCALVWARGRASRRRGARASTLPDGGLDALGDAGRARRRRHARDLPRLVRGAGKRYDAFTTLLLGLRLRDAGLARASRRSGRSRASCSAALATSRLALGVAVIGTLVPFLLLVTALRHLPASRVAVVAMLEPVLGAVIAWGVHDQALAASQILGGVIVLVAITWVQTHRASREESVDRQYPQLARSWSAQSRARAWRRGSSTAVPRVRRTAPARSDGQTRSGSAVACTRSTANDRGHRGVRNKQFLTGPICSSPSRDCHRLGVP